MALKKKKKQVKSPSPESRVPETGSDPPIGSDRDSGRDKLVSEPRFRRFWISFSEGCTYIEMCWPNADVLSGMLTRMNQYQSSSERLRQEI